MPKKQFQRICRALRRHGVAVWLGAETDAICRLQGVEAFTLNRNTVAFSKNPSRSVVFEELIHLSQFSNNKCDGSRVSRIKCEIEAKEKVLKYSKSYRLTERDIEITRRALERDYLDLKEYYEGGV